MNRYGKIMFVIAVLWHLYATAFYGWNFLPTSEGELICDGLLLLIVTVAFGLRD